MKYLLLFIALMLSACPGTETGNPAFTAQGVSTNYPSTWGYTEHAAAGPMTPPGSGDPTGPQPVSLPSIPLSEAPFTVFTDGQSTVTVYYVTLSSATDLLTYLQSIFPTRAFAVFSNPYISGYAYDDPAPGFTGGDSREYYFLRGTQLVYVVGDLFPSGLSNALTIVNSLRF